MQRRTQLLLVVGTLLLVGAAVFRTYNCCVERTRKTARGRMEIGAILPLSGDSAQYGKWIQQGLELARDEVNEQGGINGESLSVIYEDDQAIPAHAVSSMKKLVHVDEVPVVFGSWSSSCVLAQAPIAEKNRRVLMAEAISPQIREAGEYVFRIQPDARYYLEKLVPELYGRLRARRIGILYTNNDFGKDQASVMERSFVSMGGVVVFKYQYQPGTRDFKAQLALMKPYAIDALFVPGYSEIGLVLRQARQLGLTVQVVGSVPTENPDLVKIAGPAAENVIYPSHFDPDSPDPQVRKFQQRYLRKYGQAAEGFAALAYDGLNIIADSLRNCGKDSDCIREFLLSVKDRPGVTGATSFDAKGDVLKPILIKTVKNGTFVVMR